MSAIERRSSLVRREHLRRYVIEAMKDSILSPTDLLEPAVAVTKIVAVVKQDLKAIGADFARGVKSTVFGAIGSAISNAARGRSK